MGESDLEKAAVAYANKQLVTQSYQTAFADGALHLLEYLADCVKVAYGLPTFRSDKKEQAAFNDGHNQGCEDMLENLKSYCGRE